MLLATYLIHSAHAATPDDMSFFCPARHDQWDESEAPEVDDWYFGEDWADYIAAGTNPPGKSGVYPAGFRQYTLARYSEPPICMMVGDPEDFSDKFTSRDKKVEILMESPMENVNLCINDASYTGVGNNNVGSVSNCGTGKLYACFTAASSEGENFGFYVDCKDGCEDMDIDVWIRIRVSEQSWDSGKTDTASDLEHWCEKERGTTMEEDGEEVMYYTYPSDLLPDKPSQYPFHIEQIIGENAGSQARPNVWAISLIAMLGLACLFA